MGWFLLHKHEFCTLSSVLNSPLRLDKLYWGVIIGIDRSNFHTEDNDLKFTSTWELAHLPKSTDLHLKRPVNFISCLTF